MTPCFFVRTQYDNVFEPLGVRTFRGSVRGSCVAESIIVFVWVFHRVSGILLIILLATQLATGFFQASASNTEFVKSMADLHKHLLLNCAMVFLFIFHSLYGVRTILMDLGVRKEKLLFRACTALGVVLFLVFLGFYLPLVGA